MYYNIINSLKHNNQREIEKIKIYLKNKIDPKQGAKLIFDLLHIMSNSGADFFDKLRIKCGYDDSVESLIEFRDYLNSANKITSEAKGIINLSSIDFENDVQKNTTINCIKEFHLLVDEKLNKGKKLKMK